MSVQSIDSFAGRLLGWYDRAARDLPWRIPPGSDAVPDPYRVWMAEIMLQQTTVAAVAGYFMRFVQRWPTVADLAAADADRQKTDAAIAAYEKALAEAKAKAQGIANQTREAIQADLSAKRSAAEADLSAKVSAAEARIAQTKAEALTHVDEIAAETAQAVVGQLVGDVPPASVRAAVAKVKG